MIFVLIFSLEACGKGHSGSRKLVVRECPSGYASVDNCQTNLAWPDGSQIELLYSANVPDFAKDRISLAPLRLNSLLRRTQIHVVQDTLAPSFNGNPMEMARDGVNGVYFLEEPWPFDDSADSDAMTLTSFNRKHIFEFDIYYRARSFRAGTEASTGARFLRVITLHELGHGLGLIHTDDKRAIMQPSLNLRLIEAFYSGFDLEALARQYALNSQPIIAARPEATEAATDRSI